MQTKTRMELDENNSRFWIYYHDRFEVIKNNNESLEKQSIFNKAVLVLEINKHGIWPMDELKLEKFNKYKEEDAKGDKLLDLSIPNFQEKYMNHLIYLRKLKTDAEQKKASFENLKRDCMERKEEYERTIEAIKNENEKKEKDAKKILAKNNALKKEIETAEEILKDFKIINPDTILFSEPLPKQLTRDNKVNGTIPVKKLPACAYKGNIYYIVEGEKESVKGIRIGDDIIEGQVPIYQIERKKEDDKYHITKVKPTKEKQFLYKNKNIKTSEDLKKYETSPSPAINKAVAQQEERQRNAVTNTIDKMIEYKDPLIRLRWNEKENKETNAMEEAEKRLYEGWHPAFPPRTR